jgi:uncharacterized protein YkwD
LEHQKSNEWGHQLLAKAVDASGNSRTKKITVHTLNAGALAMEQELLRLINAERATRGLTLLTFNSQIQCAARKHAQDMPKNNFFGHIGSDGSNLGDRLDVCGYNWAKAGENLAAGQAMAQKAFDAWMANTGQRGILTDPSFQDGAVGCAYRFKSNL